MATAADRLTLTDPQIGVLRLIVGGERAGYVHAAADPTYSALERRELIVAVARFDDGRAHWVATFAGREWMRLERELNGGGYRRPPTIWDGTRAAGSLWTEEQLAALGAAGIDRPESVATAVVSRWEDPDTDDWTQDRRRVRERLPRLITTRDGRAAKAVTPSGKLKWLDIVRG